MSTDILKPTVLILPSIPAAKQSSGAEIGQIGMSGADLVYNDGTKWQIVEPKV